MSSKEEKFYEILDSLEKSEWTLSHKSGDNVYLVKTYKVMEHKCTVTVSVNPRDPKISLNYITITPSSIKLAKAIKEVFGEYASVGRHEKRIDVVFLVKEVYSDVAELEERIEEVFEAVREEVNRTRIEVRDYAANLMKEGYLISKEDDKYKLLKIVVTSSATIKIEGEIRKNILFLEVFVMNGEREYRKIREFLLKNNFSLLKKLQHKGAHYIKSYAFFTSPENIINTLVLLGKSILGQKD